MRKVALIVLFIMFAAPVRAVENDKVLHAAGSYTLMSALVKSGEFTKIEAFWATILVGVLKEATDNNSPNEHMRDMGASILGAGVAALTIRIEF